MIPQTWALYSPAYTHFHHQKEWLDVMFYDGHIHIEEEDQCYTCEYFVKGVMCPLLEALAVGVAHLEGDVLVKNCGFYTEFKRHLHVVDKSDSPDDDAPPQIKRFPQ